MTNFLYEIYLEQKCEARACGVTDFPTFCEWLGVVTPRENADAKLAAAEKREEE